MKLSKTNHANEFIINNALNIINEKYRNEQRFLSQIIKCTFHDGIIEKLSSSGMLNNMVFHGGTCLQRVYASDRLSEDLDFCVKEDISELADFEKFCKDFKQLIKSSFINKFKIDESNLYFKESKKDIHKAKEGDTFTWKISVDVILGESRQLIKINLENRKPLTYIAKLFKAMSGNLISSKNFILNV